MKQIIVLRYSLLMALSVATFAGFARIEAEVTKTISKNYTVTSETQLSIRNQFGTIHIDNWDKNEFAIEIEIIGKASSEEKAQRILDRIEVDISESQRLYAFETRLSNVNTRNNEGFEINYSIKMPARNPLRVKHSFGDAYLPDREGMANVDVSYGALKARNFTAGVELEVQFGSATIGSISEGEVVVKYSEVEIETAGELELDQEFSSVELEKVGILDLESKYGEVEIGEANEIEAEVDYSGFQIEKLQKSLDMDASYVSDFEIEELSPDFASIYITGDFGSYEIGILPGTSADFEGKFRYCDLRTSGVDMDFQYRVKEDNEAEYKARIGAGDKNRLIRVTSKYGNLTLRDR